MQKQKNKEIESKVKDWLENVVIGFNLCPFARKPYLKNSIRIMIDETTVVDDIYLSLLKEIDTLDKQNVNELETTLLVVPNVLASFEDYNDFLFSVNELIKSLDREGVYQVASFHPEYQFAGTDINDVENFTNRSPYPIFHLIREDSLSEALESYPNPESIPERNIKKMKSLSSSQLKQYFSWCYKG